MKSAVRLLFAALALSLVACASPPKLVAAAPAAPRRLGAIASPGGVPLVSGSVPNTLTTLLAGEDLTANVLKTEQRFTYTNQAGTTAGVTVKSGAGFLHTLTVNTPAASGVVTLYDNTAASGTKIGTWSCATFEGSFVLDVTFATGLELVVATGACDVTTATR